MFKRSLSLVLSFLFFILLLPVSSFAVDTGALSSESVLVGSVDSLGLDLSDFVFYTEDDPFIPDPAPKKYSSKSYLSSPDSQYTSDTGLYGSQLTGFSATVYTALSEADISAECNTVKVYVDLGSDVIPTAAAFSDYVAQLQKALWAFSRDYPELFYFSTTTTVGMSYGQEMTGKCFVTGIYPISDYYSASVGSACRSVVDTVTASASAFSSTYDVVDYFHSWLCENNDYDHDTAALPDDDGSEAFWTSHGAVGCLTRGKGVCESYAKSFKIFCNAVDIPCVIVTSDGHAFNYVKMPDCQWYLLDATFDDQTWGIYDGYFLVSNHPYIDSDSHVPDTEFNYPTTASEDYSEHVWSTELIPPTCSSAGYTLHTCAYCSDTYVTDETPALGHELVEHAARVPTCTSAGWDAYETCTRCDYSTYVEIPALGHDGTDYDGQPATCTEPGWKPYQICERCGESTYQPITASHVFGDPFSVEADCTDPGGLYQECQLCGERIAVDIFDPPLGHAYGTPEVHEATCTEDGYTIHTCDRCGAAETYDIVPAAGHSYSVPETVAPTCTADGYTIRICGACGDEEITNIQLATGHSYVDVVTPPTCETDGCTTHTCSLCEDSYVDNVIPALNHDWRITERIVPTVSEKGSVKYECDVCQAQRTEETSYVGTKTAGWHDQDGERYYFTAKNVPANGLVKISKKNYGFRDGLRLTGWAELSGKTYYFNLSTGVALTGWQTIDGVRYYFSTAGALQTGVIKIGSAYWALDPATGALMTDDAFADINGNTYFITGTGKVKTGWQVMDGEKYYFSGTGILQTGLKKIGSYYYALAGDGRVLTGAQEVDGTVYFFGNTAKQSSTAYGKRLTGWQTINGDKAYFAPARVETQVKKIGSYYYGFDEGGRMLLGWNTINGNSYYFKTDAKSLGRAATGWQVMDGEKYYFSSAGILQTGFKKIGSYYYALTDDGRVLTGAQEVDGTVYFFGNTAKQSSTAYGKRLTGWQTVDGFKVYFAPARVEEQVKKIGSYYYGFDTDGKELFGWRTMENGARYYFGTNGRAYTGQKTIEGETYYFNSRGILQTGVVKIGSSYYIFGENGVKQTEEGPYEVNGVRCYVKNKKAVNGWLTKDGVKYYFKNGVLQTGVIKIGSYYYGFDTDGKELFGWQMMENGARYYFGTNGRAYTGTKTVDGVKYVFSKTGVCK